MTRIGHFSRNSRIHTESVAVKPGIPQDNRHSLPDSLTYSELLLQSAIHEYVVWRHTAFSQGKMVAVKKNSVQRLAAMLVLALILLGCSEPAHERPNILFILVDDLGWSDIGPFGSEIPTPNLDEMAAAGMRYTNFHTAMKCNPTRAMFLTGLDNNIAATGGRRDWRVLPDVPTLPERLRDAGYLTLMSGKWDAGSGEGQWPHDRGFEHNVSLLGAVSSHFRAPDNSDQRDDGSTAGYAKNGNPVALPEDFYSTTFYTDRMIELIESNRSDERPFFAYLSYTAPHYPLQAPKDLIDRFSGWYEEGYQSISTIRAERLQKLGLLNSAELAWAMENVPEWSSLPASEQAYEAKRMQVYAAMVSALDDGIGSMLNYLDESELADNTLVIFASDNGADGTTNGAGYREDAHINDTDNLGNADSYVTQGFNWAQTSSTPFRMVKSHPTEGGTRSPMIVRWPNRVQAGGKNNAWFRITDISAAILELAGIDDHPMGPLAGRSALKLLTDGTPIYVDDEVRIHTYVEGRRLGGANVLKGDWKLVWWKTSNVYAEPMLFNLAVDPNETNDVAADHPDVVTELVAEWQSYKELAGEHIAEADPGL